MKRQKMAKSDVLVTPKFRVSFPAVFEPKLNNMNGKMEYGVQALFEKGTDLKALQQAVLKVVTTQWGAEKARWPANLRLPFKDQADQAKKDENGNFIEPRIYRDGYTPGAVYFNLKSKEQPGVVDQTKQPILEAQDFYAGCWARASIQAVAYDVTGNRGVSLWLRNLQKVAEGDSLSGRTKAEDDFEAVAMPEATADSMFGDMP